ncbi:hypothetical protein D8O27_30220 [Burkholderia mallei]|nr:hypothetical protein D8O31_30470 [Burkholderia mallei]RKO10219.1 hypothetical protein D8O30_30330 [Burkholderia mallei]RKO18636.1 hypothetical protein D8O27_30220 [Burkholderia mallei]
MGFVSSLNGPRGRSVFFAACVSAQRDRCCLTPDARRPTHNAQRFAPGTSKHPRPGGAPPVTPRAAA